MQDFISRRAAIDALGEEPPVWYDGEDEIAERDQWRRDKAAIEAVPSAQQGRENGEWINKNVIHEIEASTAIDEWQSAKCSVCGKYHTTPYLYYFDEYKYCPNCGALMIRKTDEGVITNDG